jgi:SAM-dependent methyltransferase
VIAAADAAGSDRAGIALDCGCGTGLITERLMPRFGGVVALDYSRQSLMQLKKKTWATDVLPVLGDARRLPFRPGVFASVVCGNAFQHLSPLGSQQAGAAELIRVTRPGGRIAVTVHHYSKPKRRPGADWGKIGTPTHHHGTDWIFRFERHELQALFPQAKIIAVGWYELCRVPKVSVWLQGITSRLCGQTLARRGYGHMLLAAVARR